jgi:ThiF family
MPPPTSQPVDYSRLERTAYARHAVQSLSVAVIGCGALGSEAARLLGLLGVGSVLLIDHDRVEPTNLTHSPHLSVLGRPKALVLAEALASLFPDTHFLPLPHEIADVGFAHLQPCALFFSCTDNALARVETAYASYRLHRPMIDAGLKGHAFWSGRVTWFPAANAASNPACYLCQLSSASRAELLSLALAASQSCATPPADPNPLPSTPTMASLTAALQVDLGLRLHLSSEPPAEAQAWEISLPLPTTSWTTHTIPRSVDCPWHRLDPTLTLTRLPMDQPLRETLGQNALLLDWPISLRARCATCQHSWSPLTRVATLRRHATCPLCGSNHLHSIETLTTLNPIHPATNQTPTQLNLPQNHLFTLKPL